MSSPSKVASTWLYTSLAGDAAIAAAAVGGVHEGIAPQDTPYPYLSFQYQDRGGRDVRVVGPSRLWSDLLILVKAVVEGTDASVAEQLAADVDRVINSKSGAAAGGRVVSCVREQPFALSPREYGIDYRQRGGIYRLQVQEN